MDIVVLESTPNPEQLICKSARNDYSDVFVGEVDYETVMAVIDGDSTPEQTQTLIEHLISKMHYGPFEHPSITFAVKGVSRSLMAQITRHRPATFDVQSQRYVDFSDREPGELVITPQTIEDIDAGGRNPHGKDLGEVLEETGLTKAEVEARRQELFENSIHESVETYVELIDLATPPEDARYCLPIGSKVNIVMTFNTRMLMHIADMRAQADAQWEVRAMTRELLDRAEEWCPNTFGYYFEHMIHRKNRLAP